MADVDLLEYDGASPQKIAIADGDLAWQADIWHEHIAIAYHNIVPQDDLAVEKARLTSVATVKNSTVAASMEDATVTGYATE